MHPDQLTCRGIYKLAAFLGRAVKAKAAMPQRRTIIQDMGCEMGLRKDAKERKEGDGYCILIRQKRNGEEILVFITIKHVVRS